MARSSGPGRESRSSRQPRRTAKGGAQDPGEIDESLEDLTDLPVEDNDEDKPE